jgi:glutaminyl-peptide cyclotransferase
MSGLAAVADVASRIVFAFCAIAPAIPACAQSDVPIDTFHVVHIYPHDPDAFTQGLVYVEGHLYESTGRNGQSSVRRVDVESGRILQKYELPSEYFGEGLTDWGSRLVQLTWTSGKGFVYDRASFKLLRTFRYQGEGWGLTHDEKSLILSDGTPTLRFLDPETFRIERRLDVIDEHGRPVENLNELEFIRGEIFANIWHEDRMARISRQTGRVLGWVDMSGLREQAGASGPEAVLNGIAYDATAGRIFVTGKLWPRLFEIKIVSRPAPGD